jgi:hypothetical protein
MFKEYPEPLLNKIHKLKQGQRKQLRRAGRVNNNNLERGETLNLKDPQSVLSLVCLMISGTLGQMIVMINFI